MANILVIRLSAIGDVAMTVPVIYSAAKANPTDSFTVLTQAFLIPVFINRPKNVNVIGINTKSKEKTLAGLLRFASALVKYDFDMVLDLHDVLRTMIIRTLFRLNGRRVFFVDKARKDRARLTDAKHKRFKQLRPVIERYADVFRNAGLHYTESFTSLYETSTPDLSALEPLAGTKTGKWIGIAPFAKHRGKIYPTGEMELVMAELSDREDFTIFLFGGRGYEEALLDQWAFEYPRVKSVAGKYSLDQELALISRLDLLICMDSANMHFASLVGTRVLSVWGATHPYAGFYGYHQDPEDCIQLDLPCRPCSVFGQKPCLRKDWACLRQLNPDLIINTVYQEGDSISLDIQFHTIYLKNLDLIPRLINRFSLFRKYTRYTPYKILESPVRRVNDLLHPKPFHLKRLIPCRPCSVFGQKPCLRKDWACMRQLNPDLIINKVLTSLNEMVSDEGGH